MHKPESLIEYVTDRPGHDFRYSLNNEKAKRELSWEPKIKFDEGIEKTVKWYLDNMSWMESKLEQLKTYWEKAYYK